MAGPSDAVSESGGEEGDYESDSDGTSTLALRRRAASDDEEEEAGGRERAREVGEVGVGGGHLTQDAASSVDGESSSRLPYSDEEEEEDEDVDDGEGTRPAYEDDEEEEDEESLLEEEGDHQRDVVPSRLLTRRRRKGSDEEEEGGDDVSVGGSKRGDSPNAGEGGAPSPAGKEVTEEEKKEAEPFVVPTAGAFYMHDDRFRDNGGARPRRSTGGRKLWEAKDEKPWVHDLFEDFQNLGHDHFSGEGFQRGGGGRGRGRGRVRGRGRGGGGRGYNNEDGGGMRSRAHGRGRGFRRDAGESVREDAPGASNYAAKASNEAEATTGLDQSRSSQSVHYQESAAVKKATSGSYLNSASPPFIPSGVLQQKLAGRTDGFGDTGGSSGQVQSRGREQYGSGARNSSRTNVETAGVSKSAAGTARGSTGRGQNAGLVWSQGDGVSPENVPQQAARPTSAPYNQQQKQNSIVSNPVADPPAHQSARGTASQAQTASFVRTAQAQGQTQQSQQGQPTTSISRSLPQPTSGTAGNNSVTSSNNTRYKGSGGRGSRAGNAPVTGRGSYIYAGAPNAGPRVGDPGFQPPPAVGPVAVQYGGQSPAGIGVPAVGMPMPNYPYGYSNTEVTWVPVLAGGGAIGASYAAPYIMEGAPSHVYYTPATAQPAAAYHLPGREINGAKHQPPGGLWKPPPSPELGTDEFGQRQSKPRRYSEMNFGQ